MAITDRTRKILWSKSGNRCAICRTHLVEPGTATDDDAVVGDECHVVARSVDGPRGGQIEAELVDDVSNLLLLCKTHHKLVDDQPGQYTSDVLRTLKAEHEVWVDRALEIAVEPPAPEGQILAALEERLLRIEFLQESLLPLRYLLLAVDLRSPAMPTNLGHFRALLTIRREGPGQELTLCVGGRDAYITQVSGGVERHLFGHQLLNWVEEPTRILQQTQISFGQPEVAQIIFEVDLRRLPGFSMIHDVAECDTWVYLTDTLWTNTSRVSIVAGDYMLGSFGRDQLAALNGNATVQWPDPLSQSELAVAWRPILPRGADYPRYEREGESADWFPANLYAPWLLDPTLTTPPRVRPHAPVT